MKNKLTKHLLISGRVQGVGFRYNLRHRAVASGVTGWCRNLPDGRVEAMLQGGPDELEVMEFWCRQGPSGARVEHIEELDAPGATEEFPTFEIRP
jgi:acylphosphatase